jgi:hypothetical protein
VRRLATWLAGIAGGVAVYRLLAQRRHVPAALPPAPPPPVVDGGPDPRAEELRAKLEESRVLVDERDEFESPETTVDAQAEPQRDSPDERRRRVHEQGRSVAARMRRNSQA